ncbi:MAG: hypothetical protein ACKVU4_11245 [Phycisphaerales bacterium]
MTLLTTEAAGCEWTRRESAAWSGVSRPPDLELVIMGIDFALDQLYATGWQAEDQNGCAPHADGRPVPGLDRIRREFDAAGFDLRVRHVQLFDCYQAEWFDGSRAAVGAVVGRTETEAAVYALSQLRKSLSTAAV